MLVTVHGTFATGAPWARADSTLARAALEWFAGRGEIATVVPFQWSGRNSIAARRAAGAALIRCLDRVHRENPLAAIYVIAHSHGGSVLAYATELRPEIVDRIDGFIALATPWVGLAPCSYAAALRELLAKMVLYVTFVASLLAVPLCVEFVFMHSSRPPQRARDGQASATPPQNVESKATLPSGIVVLDWTAIVESIVIYGLSVSTAAVLGLVFVPLRGFLSRRLSGSTAAFQRQLDGIAKNASTLHERLPRSVFLKPIGDEAALALTWTSAMAALGQSASTLLFLSLQSVRDLWTGIPRIVRIIGGLCLTAGWSMGTLVLAYSVIDSDLSGSGLLWTLHYSLQFGNWFESMTSVSLIWALLAWATVLPTLLCFVAVLLVALLAAAGAGLPSLKTALYFRISVEAIPVGSHRLVLVDVSSPPTPASTRVSPVRLSHSALYNSPDAIRAVIEALATFEAARATSPKREARSAGVDGT